MEDEKQIENDNAERKNHEAERIKHSKGDLHL